MAELKGTYYNPLQERLDNLPMSGVHYLIWFVCSLGFVLDSMDLYLISYALPLIIKEWKISSEITGFIASGAMWGMIIGAYAWGVIADRIGRRTSIQALIGSFSIFTGLCALAWNSISLFVGRFIVGTGVGGFTPVDYSIQAEFIPAKYRGRMMAASVVLWPLGGFLGAFLAFNLTPIYGWRALFVAGAVPAILIFIVRFMIPESPRFLIDRGRHEEAAKVVQWLERKSKVEPDTSIDYSSVKDQKVKPPKVSELFSPEYRSRTILASWIWFTVCLAYYGILLWLPTLMTKYYNVPQQQTLKYMMLLTAIGIAGRFLAMLFVDSWGRKPILISFPFIAAIGFFLYNTVGNTTQLLIVASLAAFFYEGVWAVMAPYTAELFPTRLRTTAGGFASSVGRVAAAIAPLMVGFVVDRSLAAIFYTFGGVMILEAIFVSIFAFETKGKALEEISA